MNLVPLSNSDLKVSPMCLGTWQFNDNTAGTSLGTWNAQEYKTSKNIVDAAIESGINFFDTAEAYQNSEVVLGKILEGNYKSRRSDLVIASKFGCSATPGSNKPESYAGTDIEDSLNTTLRNLKTDYLDLYQIHFPVVMKDPVDTVTTLKRLQSMGKIRYYGVSNFGPQTLKKFYDAGGIPISNQLPYNLLWRAIEYDIIPECRKRNLSILAYSPLAQGLLSGKYKSSVEFPEGRRRIRLFAADSTSIAYHSDPGCEKEVFEALEGIRTILAKSKDKLDSFKPKNGPVETKSCKSDTNSCGGGNCELTSGDQFKKHQDAGYGMINLSLDWILNQPQIASVIVGASTPAQVQQFCQYTHGGKIDKNIVDALNKVTDQVKKAIGDNPDMWFTKSRYN